MSKRREDLQSIEGVGPKTLEKLRELGVTSVEHLAEFTVEELVEAGIEYDRAVKLLQQALQRVGAARPLTLREMRQRQVKAFKTGVAEFDEKTPWRGIREAFIYEFAGEFGAGKSMLAHQASVAALREGFTERVVYIDTEGTFNEALIEAVARRFELDVERIADSIYVYQPANVVQLEQIVKFDVPKHIQEGCRLLVIDTITALYRAEFVGREYLATRQQRIHYLVDWLRRHARTFGLTTVLTNQVMDVPEIFAAGVKRPAGGNVLAHAVNARFMMVRPNKTKPEGYIWPLDVPGMAPDIRIEYRITGAGLE
ncbi:helix-hairpin-helix domain-containing protein [Pyrobaculum aerophilum]|uniref:DNA repair and recombination protein RadA n=2 Tax=Pyrobaculum aerophilum TaxID=13773 RepID=Q8ZTI5_PYRAE|nr:MULTISPECIES: helix-hairpin-helix domain-containing protein [Pyrobaculum]AAL64776.1 DNA repair protein radA [Pyrobaculum aerophilum str. IM2]MCX8136287.1 helix-hairpin-helix domain-containing protein [Pyrobaculum aerophilum]HII47613.1 DNA repair protein RadA [Pyrobaculum aerophilum]